MGKGGEGRRNLSGVNFTIPRRFQAPKYKQTSSRFWSFKTSPSRRNKQLSRLLGRESFALSTGQLSEPDRPITPITSPYSLAHARPLLRAAQSLSSAVSERIDLRSLHACEAPKLLSRKSLLDPYCHSQSMSIATVHKQREKLELTSIRLKSVWIRSNPWNAIETHFDRTLLGFSTAGDRTLEVGIVVTCKFRKLASMKE